MSDSEPVDLRNCSFERFVELLFEHEVPSDSFGAKPWYWSTEVTIEPVEVCRYYIRLFRDPECLLAAYSTEQLEQGFWAIQSCNLDCSAPNVIWHEEVPFELREQCVRSMFELFDHLFAFQPLETSVEMWWDSLCYDWHCGNRKRENGGEDLKMQDVMFDTLSRILSLTSPCCWGAALHGMGHLHHPQTSEVIGNFLKNNPTLNDAAKNYALAAMRFEVM
jgi:hypothetical protein